MLVEMLKKRVWWKCSKSQFDFLANNYSHSQKINLNRSFKKIISNYKTSTNI